MTTKFIRNCTNSYSLHTLYHAEHYNVFICILLSLDCGFYNYIFISFIRVHHSFYFQAQIVFKKIHFSSAFVGLRFAVATTVAPSRER